MKRKINIGILHSLSGTMSFSESALIDAAMMAVDEINQSGGVMGATVVPLVEDCASDAEVYALKTRQLAVRKGVEHFFGCWTSASRKAVKPVVEANNALLWYPVQYEGLEESPNIVYTGNCLNQQIEPAVRWTADHLGGRCYLVGSDYVFPRTANKLIRTLCRRLGVQVVGESYLPLGAESFEAIIDDIISLNPDVVFNTINGDSNLAFYYYLGRAGNKPEKIPVMAFSIGEVELRDIGLSVIGHYACAGYFQCLDSEENRHFIHRFKRRYGDNRVVSDPVVSAYNQPFLWKQLVEKTGSFDVDALRPHIAGVSHSGPSGAIEIYANHHAARPALIGKVNADLQFDIVWQHPGWIEPLPWLGLENLDLTAGQMMKEALAAFPESLVYSGELNHEKAKRSHAESDLKKERSANKLIRSQYRALFKSVPVGIVIVDLETGLIKDCNPWFENQVGKTKSVLKKQYIWELVPPDDRQGARRTLFEMRTIGDERDGRAVFCRPDGQPIRFSCRNTAITVNGKSLLQSIMTPAENRQ